jgi:hypothetical protein
MTVIVAEDKFWERVQNDFQTAKQHIEQGKPHMAVEALDYTTVTLDEIHWALTEWGGPLILDFDSVEWDKVKPPIVFAGHGSKGMIGSHAVRKVESKLMSLPDHWNGGIYLLACNVGEKAAQQAETDMNNHYSGSAFKNRKVRFIGGFERPTASTSGKRAFVVEKELTPSVKESFNLKEQDYKDIEQLIEKVLKIGNTVSVETMKEIAKKTWEMRRDKGFHKWIEELARVGFYKEVPLPDVS